MNTSETAVRLDRDNPWPALLSYGEKDASFFGGRDEMTERLFRRVACEALTLVHSPSGLGKTSLLQAGLFPRLRKEHYFPVYLRLEYVSGRSAVQQIKDAIVDQAKETNVELTQPLENETLWEYFHRPDVDFWDERNFPCKPVLVFDQFEELFIKGAKLADELVDQLSHLIEGATPPSYESDGDENLPRRNAVYGGRCRVVVAIRSDHMARLEAVSDRFRTIFSNRFAVRRLSGEDALKSILKAGGHLMDESVARRIVRFVGGKQDDLKGEPPADEALDVANLQIEPALLSVICCELNEVRKTSKTSSKITAAMLSGERDKILTNFFDRSFRGTPCELRDFVEDELVVKGGVGRDSISEAKARQHQGVSDENLQKLVERRVIRIEEIGSARMIELTHDRLAEVAARGRDFRAERKAAAAAEEARLKAVAEAEQARKKSRRAQAAALAFLVLAVGIVVIPMIVRQRTMRQEHRKQAQSIVMYAEQAFTSERDSEGLAYLANALRLDPDNTVARAQAYDRLAHRPWPVLVMSMGEGKVEEAAIDSEGVHAATYDGTNVAVWDLASRQKVTTLRLGSVDSLRFLLNGRLLVSFRDYRMVMWDPKEGLIPFAPETRQHDGMLSPDGEQLATVVRNGVVVTRSRTNDTVLSDPFILKQPVRFIRWSPDARRVVLFGNEGPVVWDLQKRQTQALDNGVKGMAFTEEGKYAVTFDGVSLRLLDASSLAAVSQPVQVDKGGGILSARVSPSGDVLMVVTNDQVVRLYSIRDGRPVGSPMRHAARVTAAAFSADGLRILTASADKTARCWTRYGEPIGVPIVHKRAVSAAVFSRDGRSIITVADRVRTWRMTAAVPDPLFEVGDYAEGNVTSNGKIAIIDGNVRTAFSLSDGGRLWVEPAEDSSIVAIASHLPVFAASESGDNRDNSLILFDSRTGKEIWRKNLPPGDIESARFIDDDRTLVVLVGKEAFTEKGEELIAFFATADGKEIRSRIKPEKGLRTVATSDWNGLIALAGRDRVVTVMNWRTNRVVGMVTHTPFNDEEDENDASVAFSKDGKRLITTSVADGVRVWEVGQQLTRAATLEIPDDDERPTAAYFCPDGASIITRAPSMLRVWNATTFEPKSGEIAVGDDTTPAFTADGSRFVVMTGAEAQVWDVATMSRLTRISIDESSAIGAMATDGTSFFTLRDGWLVRVAIPRATERDFNATLLADLAEAVAGVRLANSGEMERVDDPQRLPNLAASCKGKNDAICSFVRWYNTTPQRVIGPESRMSVADFFKNVREKTPERWQALATLFPGHPDLGPEPPS